MDTQPNLNTCIFALYGQYVLPRGGEIWLGTLVRSMAALGFSEAAVRSMALRLKNRGMLESRRQGRRAFYWLTGAGLDHLNRGGFRFSLPPEGDWDGQWTVVVYSIPEERRQVRDALRDMLNWWGFGLLAPGTWLSTRLLPEGAEKEWRELGVWSYLSVFRSEYWGPGDLSSVVARAFPQLPALAEQYRLYIARSEAILTRSEADLLDDDQCFAYRLRNIAEIVPLILKDPSLPTSLLPEDWPRTEAERLAQEVQEVLREPAERYFSSVFRAAG